MQQWKKHLPWILIFLFALGLFLVPPRTEIAGPIQQVIELDSQSGEMAKSAVLASRHPQTAATAAVDPLENSMRRDIAGLTVTEHPDGRKSIHLGGRFQHVSRLVTLPTGQKIPRCFSSYTEMLEVSDTIQEPPNEHSIPTQADF